VDAHVRGQGFYGELVFVAFAAVFTGLGLPRQMAAFLGGYAFGFLGGTWWGLLGALGGCVASFYWARFLGRSFIRRRHGGRIQRLNALLEKNTFSMTLIIRFLPVGSNLLTNLVAGVSAVKPLRFFAGSFLGYVPQTLVFALLGSGIRVDPLWRTLLSVLLFLVSSALGVWLYRRNRLARSLES
jgi:uncharacterized membrane protein YdjX (TVP38/TMEM64 family)